MIGIIVINFLNNKETISFVKNLLELQYDDKHVCVIDNSSDINEFNSLERSFADAINVSLINAGSNLGYAKANNLASSYLLRNFSNIEYLLFSNTDIILPDTDILVYLKNKMDQNHNIACCNPKILDSKEVFIQSPFKSISFQNQFTLRYFFFPLKRFFKQPYFWDDLVYNASEGDFFRLSGAFLMVRASHYQLVNGFDENTFLYAEESILSHRFREKSLLSMYFPDKKVYHEVSQTIGKHFDSKQKAKLILESNIYYYMTYRGLKLGSVVLAKIGWFIFYNFYRLFKF